MRHHTDSIYIFNWLGCKLLRIHTWFLNAVRADRLVYCCQYCNKRKEDFDPAHREEVLEKGRWYTS